MHDEPIMDVAHLAHLEILTPKPEESLRFFVDVMGMTESGRKGNSVYLRGWDDYERYSLQLRLFDATSTKLRPFFAQGGRLILWHGVADQDISPRSTIAWWHA